MIRARRPSVVPREKRGSRLAGDQAFLKRGEGEPAGFISARCGHEVDIMRQTAFVSVRPHTLRDRAGDRVRVTVKAARGGGPDGPMCAVRGAR